MTTVLIEEYRKIYLDMSTPFFFSVSQKALKWTLNQDLTQYYARYGQFLVKLTFQHDNGQKEVINW